MLGVHAQGVWADGQTILSVGLDQRLRMWRIAAPNASGEGLAAQESASTVVQVLEPEAMAVQPAGEHSWQVAVVGRGSQVLRLSNAT